jgi:hypothetical protein
MTIQKNMYDDVVSGARESTMELMAISTRNYYNERQQLIRVNKIDTDKYFDVRLYPTTQMPNPNIHMCIVMASSSYLDGVGIPDERLDLEPGYQDKEGNINTLPEAIGFIVNKTQEIKVANPQNGSSGFNVSNINTYDQNKLRIAISPPIDKSYTNNSQNEGDQNLVGIFMNDNVLVARSAGGSITLGEEGVHIGGKVFLEGGKQNKDIVADNPLHGIIPQTIPTAIVSIPQIPNFAMIVQIADTAQTLMSVVQKTSTISNIIT